MQEQREALKQQGQKHEDTIMKDNARLQKEVKHRIHYMKDYIEKIDKGILFLYSIPFVKRFIPVVGRFIFQLCCFENGFYGMHHRYYSTGYLM